MNRSILLVDEFKIWRCEMRRRILDKIKTLDPSDPETLIYIAAGMIETHFGPRELSEKLGTSRTTVGRWATRQNVPRSAPFRKWAVETLTLCLIDAIEGKPKPQVGAAATALTVRKRTVGASGQTQAKKRLTNATSQSHGKTAPRRTAQGARRKGAAPAPRI